MLISAFKELTQAPNTQVFLTTHTPALGGMIEKENLRFVTKDEQGKVVVEAGSEDTFKKVAETLGVLPDPLDTSVRLMICVEGPNDVIFMKSISTIINNTHNHLPDLNSDSRVVIFPLGGSTLKDWVNNDYLKKLGIPEYHIYDRDDMHNPPYQDRADAVNARGGKYKAVLTTKRETENYIHREVINAYFGININFTDTDDVPLLVAQAIHANAPEGTPWPVDEKKIREKTSRAKKRLNYEVAPLMTLNHITEIDTNNDILTWLAEINERINQQ
jgi:hypothetical protein